MENILSLIIPIALTAALIRLLLLPIRWITKVGIHGTFGFLCLWVLNSVSGITGVYLPINAVTVLIAGILGVPGIGLIGALEMMA